MAKQLDPKIGEVLKKYEFGADACWNCHGTWVVYHRVLEQIAAKAGIQYDKPDILVASKEAAAILVSGSLENKTEWSIGEAAIGQNYKVSGNQAAYPFAMAEKRAKDRVILKLIGLHGIAYSEEEADDFKSSAPKQDAAPAKQEQKPAGTPDVPDIHTKEYGMQWLTQAAEKGADDLASAWKYVANQYKDAPFIDELIAHKNELKSKLQQKAA